MGRKKGSSILFVCRTNSTYSQIMEGVMKDLRPDWEVQSAGLEPDHVELFTIYSMTNEGYDIRRHRAKSLEEFSKIRFDYVVIADAELRAGDLMLPAHGKLIEHPLPDPYVMSANDESQLMDNYRIVVRDVRDWLSTEFPE